MIRLSELVKKPLPKKKWVKVSGAELDAYKEEILKLIQNAYSAIGGHPNYNHASDISDKDAQAFELIDLDNDPDPDAVSVTKKKKAGTKFVGTGHDGTKDAKLFNLMYMTERLNLILTQAASRAKSENRFEEKSLKLIEQLVELLDCYNKLV